MTKRKVIEKIREWSNQFSLLVWYAKQGEEEAEVQLTKDNMKWIKRELPRQVDALSGEDGEFVDGFNNGCLEALGRVIMLFAATSPEEAQDVEDSFLNMFT